MPLDGVDQRGQRIGGRVADVDHVDGDELHGHRGRRAIELLDIVRVGAHPEGGRQSLAKGARRVGWSVGGGEGGERVGGTRREEMVPIGH